MITKVSYRPYASGVNNTQKQPQKVNFGANIPSKVAEKLTPEVLQQGLALRIKLLELATAGASRDSGQVSAHVDAICAFLKQCHINAETLGKALEEVSRGRLIGGRTSLF